MAKEQENKSINGIFETEEGNIVFYAEKFKFAFINPDFSGKSIMLKADSSGYIHGKTYGGKRIAVFSNGDIRMEKVRVLNTWNYITSKSDYAPIQCMQSVRGIRFKNGVIRTVYPCNGLHRELERSEGKYLAYRMEKDCREYSLKQEKGSAVWQFLSEIRTSRSIDEGTSLSNTASILDIIFEEEQELSAFGKFYGYVCDLCSFLTFRSNVSFENILLFYEFEGSKGKPIRDTYAECHVKSFDMGEQRKTVDIIPIRCLRENVFLNMIKNIMKADKKHKGLPVAIAPRDDLDVRIMDMGKIRSICSALEMELDLEGVRLPENKEMKKLVDSVRQLVKDHRAGDAPMTEKTYDYIFGNLSHWGQPLAERAWEAWRQHEKEMAPFLKKYDISITQEDIQKFVKSRNDITHNGSTGMSDEACMAAFALMGLVYCCALTRLGMEPAEIEGVMSRRLIG